MELTRSQFEVLCALIDLYRELRRPIRSVELAARLGRSDGTVRNMMSSLKVLGLVDARTGPQGGYTPTAKGVEIVERGVSGLREPLILEADGMATRIRVVDIELIDIPSPLGARAILKVLGRRGLERTLREGMRVKVGPTPYTRLVIAGRIASIDEARSEVVVEVDTLAAVPRATVRDLMSRRLIKATADSKVSSVARLLLQHNIRAVPVVDGENRLVGLATAQAVMNALLEGRGDEAVGLHVEKDIVTVHENADIVDVMEAMNERGVGRVVVVDGTMRPLGIVTRTDVLRRLVAWYTLREKVTGISASKR